MESQDANEKDADENALLVELGSTGLQRQGGFIQEEFLPALRGRQAAKVYREMSDNDPIVSSVMFAIEMLLRGVDWTIEQPEDGGALEADIKFVKECRDDMSTTWPDFIAEVMSMLRHGWAWFEVVYKQRNGELTEADKKEAEEKNDGIRPASSKFSDGKYGWRKFAFRSQETLSRWEFDEADGGIIAMVQAAPPRYEPKTIPITKSLLFRTTTQKNNPEGRSILRGAYRSWFFKKRFEEIEAIGIERDIAGLPVLHLPPAYMAPDATPAMKAAYEAYKELVINIRRDRQEGVILPSVYEDGNKMISLELLSASGSRQFDIEAVIGRLDQRIAMIALADFILLGHEKVGSFALSSDKTDLFAVALGAWLDMIESVLNTYAIPRLFAVNGVTGRTLPVFKHADIETPNLQEVAAYITAIVGAGATLFPDEDLENWLRRIAKLPEKSKEAIEAQDEAKEQAKQEAKQKPLFEEGEEDEEEVDENDEETAA